MTVFAQRGFAGASIKAIAESSGVSQSLILHHFKGGKPELWATIKAQAVTTFAAAFPRFDEEVEVTRPLVREGFRAYFDFCVTHPDLMKIGLWVRVTEGTSKDWGGEGDVFSQLTAVAARAQALGYIRADIPTFDLLMIFSGAIKSWVFDGQHFLDVSQSQTQRERLDDRFFESTFRLVAQ